MSEYKSKDDVVMWVRLPKPMNVKSLRKAGLAGAACYGGDTCIAAATMNPKAGIVIQTDFENILRREGFQPDAACFGGDTCIV